MSVFKPTTKTNSKDELTDMKISHKQRPIGLGFFNVPSCKFKVILPTDFFRSHKKSVSYKLYTDCLLLIPVILLTFFSLHLSTVTAARQPAGRSGAGFPNPYRACRTFSDFWRAYANVFSGDTHQSVGKESGETTHMERWNNTLRQRFGRMTQKTLSFSKGAAWHNGVIH